MADHRLRRRGDNWLGKVLLFEVLDQDGHLVEPLALLLVLLPVFVEELPVVLDDRAGLAVW